MVTQPFELAALEAVYDFQRLIAKGFFQERARYDQVFEATFSDRAFYGRILYIGVNSDGYVAGQRPGSGRPNQQGGAGPIYQGHTHVDRGVFRLAITKGHFVLGKGRAAAWAIRNHLRVLVEQLPVPQLLQNPPYRFDVFVGEGYVGVLQINPKAEAFTEFRPFLDMFNSRFAA